MTTTFIYGLVDPRNPDRFRYVGKSNCPQARLKGHLYTAQHGNKTHRSNWIRQLLADQQIPVVIILEEVKGELWSIAERYWIKKLRTDGHPLTNDTDGGDGSLNMAKEARQRISIALTGRVISDETRAKQSLAQRGKPHPWQRKLSEETKAKISNSKKGKPSFPRTPEYLAKLSISQKGRPKSLITRQRLSNSLRGRPLTQDHVDNVCRSLLLRNKPRSKAFRRRQSKLLKGRKFSASHRAALSLAKQDISDWTRFSMSVAQKARFAKEKSARTAVAIYLYLSYQKLFES